MAVKLKIGRRAASFSRKRAASAVRSTIVRDAKTGKFVKIPNAKKPSDHSYTKESGSNAKR